MFHLLRAQPLLLFRPPADAGSRWSSQQPEDAQTLICRTDQSVTRLQIIPYFAPIHTPNRQRRSSREYYLSLHTFNRVGVVFSRNYGYI